MEQDTASHLPESTVTKEPHLKFNFETRTFRKFLRQTRNNNINNFDVCGYTALHWATRTRSVKLMKLLLNHGADINAQDKVQGKTALHLALTRKSQITVEVLLTREANVNVKDQRKWTALHQAVLWHNIPADLFKIIIEKSPNLNAKTILGRTALHLALRNRSAIVTEQLLNDGQNSRIVDIKDGRGKTALHYAAKWRDIPPELFENILQKSANVNVIDMVHKSTSLHFALENQSGITAARLLKRPDINLDIKNKKHSTALHFAAQWDEIPSHLFCEMIQKTSDVNARDTTGSTALHLAINAKSITTTAKLLKHVDVNIEDNERRTAIQLMNLWQNAPVYLRKLLDGRLNADCEQSPVQTLSDQIKCQLPDNDADYLHDENLKDEPNMVLQFNPNRWPVEKKNSFQLAEEELRQLCADDFSSALIEKIKKMIGTGINVNAKDRYGRNALHFLCRANSSSNLIDVIRLLIQLGIDVKAECVLGKNALHYLCQKNSTSNLIEAIQELIRCGIEVNAKDNVGWNALNYLCVYNLSSTLIEAVKLVIEYEIDVNTKSSRGWNALHYLCLNNSSSGLITVIQILIQKGINIVSDGHDARSILREHYRKSNKKEIIKLLDEASSTQSQSTLKATSDIEL